MLFYNAFLEKINNFLEVANEAPLAVSEVAKDDHEQIDQRPDTKPSEGEKHQDPCAHLPNIEAVDAQ